jgi:hypothetical protein
VLGLFNIKKGSFGVNYISEGLAEEIEASFVDAALDYQAQTIRVKVPGVSGTPQRTAKIDLFGITSATNAMRHTRLLAAAQFFHRRRISWTTDAEGLMVRRGDVVMLSHDLTQWDYSGRIIGWNAGTRTFTLDRSVPRTAGDYVQIRWPNGYVHIAACPGTGSGNTIVLTNPLPTVGDDATVLFPRQGRVAFNPVVIRGADAMAVAGREISWPRARPGRLRKPEAMKASADGPDSGDRLYSGHRSPRLAHPNAFSESRSGGRAKSASPTVLQIPESCSPRSRWHRDRRYVQSRDGQPVGLSERISAQRLRYCAHRPPTRKRFRSESLEGRRP